MTAPLEEPLPSRDLSPLFQQPRQPTTRFGQGRLLSWNPETFESIVQWQGARLSNLPVLAGMDALTFKAGMDVLLIGWDGGGRRGAQDWAILSRAIEPGPAAAEEAIEPMRTRLAQQIAAEVFAARIRAAEAAGEVQITSSSWVVAPGGPEVTDVEVSETGVALVTIGSRLAVSSQPGSFHAGFMSFQVTGPTNIAPSFERATEVTVIDVDELTAFGSTPSREVVLTGLDPGTYTFSARYLTEPGGAGNPLFIEYRSLSVIAL